MAQAFGLTANELHATYVTWKLVMDKHICETAGNFVLKWFEKDPSIVNLFPHFKGKTLAELKAIPRVRVHGIHIFEALNGIIRNMWNEPVCEQLLLDLKTIHVGIYPKASERDFKTFSILFEEYIAGILGRYFTPDAVSGYRKVLAGLARAGAIF